MLEILMFILKQYIENDLNLEDLDSDQKNLMNNLEHMGFMKLEISKALTWLADLEKKQDDPESKAINSSVSFRHFLPEESDKIDAQCRGLIMHLEQIGILDPLSRELVIDRLMAFDDGKVDQELVKWVSLVVLYSQPNKKTALSCLQDKILHTGNVVIH